MASGLLHQRWFDVGDLETLLAVAGVSTDEGRPWTRRECMVWLQAAGEWHDGQTMARRSKVRATFPEVFERLGMSDD